MPNSIDFRADQIQTKQIIVTGSGAGTTKLLIYGIEAQGSPVNEGIINTTYFPQDGIGGDVFLYVSGALNTKGSATERGTSVFGGDLVVSGSLYNGLVPAAGNRGIYSHAEGLSTLASGAYSHAEGRETRAIGSGSHAEGYGGAGYASGNYSHAEGQATIAYGAAAHAEGYQTNASGDYCHTEGQDTYVTTNGDYSHAEGHLTKVDNRYAHAEGYGTLASNLYAHAEGYLATGSGQASHAEGYGTLASNLYAHAEGYLTTGSGQASHAEGYQTNTLGQASHAEGYQTQTTGAYSHAQGSGSITWGIYSFAAGNRTIASGSVDVTQAAFGRFNKRNNTTSLFVVGNGTGDSDALRGDIFRAESTGQLVLSGGISNKVKNVTFPSVSYNLTLNDYLVIVNVNDSDGTGPFNVYLPSSATTPIGTTYVIRRLNSSAPNTNIVSINPGSATDQIIGNNMSYVGTPIYLTGVSGTKNGGCVTLTYIGNYVDTRYGNHPTWMTTSELDL